MVKPGQPGRLAHGQRASYGLMGQTKGPHVLTSSARAGKGLRGRANGFYGWSGASTARGAALARLGAARGQRDANWPRAATRPSTSRCANQARSLGYVTQACGLTAL